MDQLASVLPLAGGLLWVDLLDEPLESCRRLLLETFGFHPLAVDDALEEQHVPRVDDWGNYLYLVLHTVLLAQQETTEIDTLELDIFLGHNYLVTYHTQPIDVISRVQRACQRDDRHLRRGAGHLLYKLIDELVADYMPVVDQIDEVIDRVEDQIFDDTGTVLLEEVFTLKRGLLHLRRIIAPQREVLNKLARGDFAVIRPEDRVFFRDIYDHLVRLYDITEGLRDLVGGALDTYLSVVNNRMNDVMKTLTIITTLFMPVSFLAGFFGINFFQAVEPLAAWTSRPAFIAMLAAMTVTPLVMYLWMRRRRLV
jgi:magnesium transporter